MRLLIFLLSSWEPPWREQCVSQKSHHFPLWLFIVAAMWQRAGIKKDEEKNRLCTKCHSCLFCALFVHKAEDRAFLSPDNTKSQQRRAGRAIANAACTPGRSAGQALSSPARLTPCPANMAARGRQFITSMHVCICRQRAFLIILIDCGAHRRTKLQNHRRQHWGIYWKKREPASSISEICWWREGR